MRGKSKVQPEFCALINLNERVPVDHPLRGIKQRVDVVLKNLSREFDELYADEGRPSIPPEQLIKSRILMALYSVRSERLFCEQLAYTSSGFGFWTGSWLKGVLTRRCSLTITSECSRPMRPSYSLPRCMICRGKKAGVVINTSLPTVR